MMRALRTVALLWTCLAGWTPPAAMAAAPRAGIVIKDCAVFSVANPAMRYDCTTAARELCDGQAACELPIGRSLSGGKDIDGASEEKVRLEYLCSGQERVHGPHFQNDHAAMILRCR